MDHEQASAELSRKLDPSHVQSRKQGGTQVSYIEAWHAIDTANRIFGFFGWTRETLDLRCVCERERQIGQQQKQGWTVTYTARVRVTADGLTREGSGAGHGIGSDLGEAHESALKEAESDAMKRALMTFGYPFGLALYDKSRANVGKDEPPFQPESAADRIVKRMASCEDLQSLQDAWKAEQGTIKALRDASDDAYQRVITERNKRKAYLAQAPDPDEGQQVNGYAGSEPPF